MDASDDRVYVTDPPIKNRIEAAMAFAGLNGYDALARKIGRRGYGEKTLRKISDEKDTSRSVGKTDITVFSQATGLAPEFFTLPIGELVARLRTEAPDIIDRLARLERERETMRSSVNELREMVTRLTAESVRQAQTPPAPGETGRRRRRQGGAGR